MPEAFDDPSLEKTDWKKQWQVLRRRRWYLALPAFLVWMVVWAVAWVIPAVYRSETVILVEQPKVPEQYVVPNVTADLQDQLQSMSQKIKGRERLLSIIKELNLYPKLRARVTEDELLEQMRKDIQVEPVQAPNRSGNLTAFKVAYLSNTPAMAQKVTAELTSLFINENLKARKDASVGTTDFLAAQLEEAGRRLAEQEAKVKEFKSQYLGQLPEQVQSNVQILAGLQSQLQQDSDLLGKAKEHSVYLESLRSQWRSLEETNRSGNAAGTVTPAVLDQELVRLREQLAELLSKYTERHPDVKKVKDQIAKTERMKQQMEAQLAAKPASEATEPAPHPTSPSEMQALSSRMEVESQIKANKLEIENHERAIRELQKQIGEYQARLNMTPVREQQLAALTRDYEQSRKNYEQLLAKRDQSGMATDLEKRQEGEQFRVLDPANLPQKPFSPNRLRLDLIGLVAGLMFGAVVVAGAEVVDDRIYSKDQLATIVSAPILTEVPPLLTTVEGGKQIRTEWMQRGMLSVLAALVAVGFASTYFFG